jgi:hypothetical protein
MKLFETKKCLLLIGMLVIFLNTAIAQDKSAEAKYREVVTGRADKIVKDLGIQDTAVYRQVRDRVAEHYVQLNKVYTQRDSLSKLAKTYTADKKLLEGEKTIIEDGTMAQVGKIHDVFVADLSKNLNEGQVASIKDGLTYNVLNVTYIAYQDMIPSLTQPQKEQIYAWLVEARDYAMDAESSDKKHWWFGKYKGRINNYLSAQGYDLQAERTAWEKRLAEKKEKGN